MKKYIRNIFLVFVALAFSQCYTEIIEEITEIPYDEIESKLDELRKLQSDINKENVESTDIQARIDDLIRDINNLVPPPPAGALPISYSIGIVNAARESGQIGVSGATVSIDIDGVRTTATTDSDGQVLFENLRSGVVLVHVEVVDFTDVSFVADLLNSSENIATKIAVYPTTAANGAVTIDGLLRYDPDRTNDLIAPVNPLVNYVDGSFSTGYEPAIQQTYDNGVFQFNTTFNLDATVQSWQLLDQAVNVFGFIQPNAADYGFIPAANPGNIILAIYEEMFATATSNAADGTFQLVLPARGNMDGNGGNNFRMHFAEFVGNELYIRAVDITLATTSTRTRSVVYTALYGEFDPQGTFSGTYNPGAPFDDANVNNFTGNIFSKGANATISADFFFAAKTRDE